MHTKTEDEQDLLDLRFSTKRTHFMANLTPQGGAVQHWSVMRNCPSPTHGLRSLECVM